jgi:hypothetical protein
VVPPPAYALADRRGASQSFGRTTHNLAGEPLTIIFQCLLALVRFSLHTTSRRPPRCNPHQHGRAHLETKAQPPGTSDQVPQTRYLKRKPPSELLFRPQLTPSLCLPPSIYYAAFCADCRARLLSTLAVFKRLDECGICFLSEK